MTTGRSPTWCKSARAEASSSRSSWIRPPPTLTTVQRLPSAYSDRYRSTSERPPKLCSKFTTMSRNMVTPARRLRWSGCRPAVCQRIDRHPLVGLVGLGDVAGAQHDGGVSGWWKSAASVQKSTSSPSVNPVCARKAATSSLVSSGGQKRSVHSTEASAGRHARSRRPSRDRRRRDVGGSRIARAFANSPRWTQRRLPKCQC